MSSLLRQRGLSLIEILLSLAIISVILMMIVNYYSTQNKDQVLVSKAAAQIQQLASVSYEWQTAQSKMDFTGITLTVLQDAGLLSTTIIIHKNPRGAVESRSLPTMAIRSMC